MSMRVGSTFPVEDFANTLKSIGKSGSRLVLTDVSVTQGYGELCEIQIGMRMHGRADIDDVSKELGFTHEKPTADWISVRLEKPESDEPVLVSRGDEVGTATYWGKKHGWSVSPAPTHWMPMPSPPESKSSKKETKT